MYLVNFGRLVNAATKLAITNLAITNGSAITSQSVKIDKNVGFLVLLVTENRAGGMGDVDIYAEYSDDNVTFYRPYISDLAGTITVEGNIVTALQNVSRRIHFTARMAKYVRFVFDPDADSTITADLSFQEEN